jgi:hypothetical protein
LARTDQIDQKLETDLASEIGAGQPVLANSRPMSIERELHSHRVPRNSLARELHGQIVE